MKKRSPKSKRVSSSRKALKSPVKAIRKVIEKIKSTGRKAPVRLRVLVKRSPKEKLVLKKSIADFIQSTAAREASGAVSDTRLPAYYSEDKLVLLVRDPWWIFSYWEVTPGRQAHVQAEMARQGLQREKTVLRVYDRTSTSDSPAFFDIEIHHLNSSWYVDVGRPDREWVAEIGYKTRDGRFFALVRSNVVKTPPFGISDVLDEEWMMPDELYFKLLKVMGGLEEAGDSLQVRKILEKYIRQSASSEGVSRLARTAPPS